MKLTGGDLAGDVLAEQLGDLVLTVALADAPHELGHGGFGGHVPGLHNAQIQQLVANLVDPQVGGIIEALGGDDHGNAILHSPLDAPQTLAQEIDAAQAEGFDDNV